MSTLQESYDSGRFLVLVSPPRNDPALFKAAFEAGVDGAKVHLNVDHRASGNRFGSWDEEKKTVRSILKKAPCPIGVMPGAETLPSPADFKAMKKAGIDFFDVYLEHMEDFMWELPMTRMIALGHGADPAEAKALEKKGMDVLEASIVDPAKYGDKLSAEDLEVYRALRAATQKPILVPSQKALEPEDLVALKQAGVDSVLLGVLAIGDTPESFAENLPGFVELAESL